MCVCEGGGGGGKKGKKRECVVGVGLLPLARKLVVDTLLFAACISHQLLCVSAGSLQVVTTPTSTQWLAWVLALWSAGSRSTCIDCQYGQHYTALAFVEVGGGLAQGFRPGCRSDG